MPEQPDRSEIIGFGRIELPKPPSPDEGFGYQPPSKIDPHTEARTARTIAFSLVTLLVVSVVAQYAALIILTIYNRGDAIPNFEHLFNNCFPVLAGLVGSAVTYYLTKEKK